MKTRTRILLGAGLVLLQIADLWTTASVLDAGGSEANPLVRGLLDAPVLLWSIKVGLSSIIAVFVAYIASPTLDVALVIAVAIYTAIVLNNLLLIG